MKKSRKRILIIGVILLVVAIAGGLFTYDRLTDKNRLTLNEKKWINNNVSTIQNINVVNNINNFGTSGTGVFFDFLEDFSKEHGITLNPVTYNKNESVEGLTFKLSTAVDSNDLVFFRDHFVLISKNETSFKSIEVFKDKNIGILSTYYSYVTGYLADTEANFTSIETVDDMFTKLDAGEEISYVLVPLNEYIDKILTKDYQINFHIGDIPIYYSLQTVSGTNEYLSDIMTKFYNTWITSKFDSSYNSANLDLFVNSLNISKKEQDTLTSQVFNYGFIENSPYEIIMSGNYGGIISAYLKKFSDFSNVEFKFIKYKDISTLNKAINNKDINIYFNSNDTVSEFKTIPSQININFSILANKNNDLTVNTLKTLSNEKIYVLKDSLLGTYLSGLSYLDIETFDSYRDMFKLAKKDVIIALDTNIFNYYSNKELKDFTIRYEETLDNTYNFKTNVNDTFYNLFNKYVNSLDPDIMVNLGIYNHEETVKSGTLFSTIAKYILIALVAILVIGFVYYRSSKRIKIAKRIKKDDKMRFIDQLTSLKNRNYLSENIEGWNKNTIYPQATIVMDLNQVQEINDTLGYDQGDSQIKAAANILIKTQLDNSDIIRTDGNEFLIYLVGYDEKKVVSYIRKLYKELKNLPFDYGASIGHSMIIDDLKTIEDAINEAVEDMRIKKEEQVEE